MVSAALVGQVIQSYRLRKGMSQEVLSGLAGLDRTHYSKIERGLRSPTLDTLFKIAQALDIPPSDIVGKLSSKYQSTPNHNFMGGKPVEQKIKQDSIRIGENIRRIRLAQHIKQTQLVQLLQLEGINMTRETLVKIERGVRHIEATQLRGIRDALHTTYDELFRES